MKMISQADKVVYQAEGWRGYFEKASNKDLEKFLANAGSANYTIFGRWYEEYSGQAGFINAQWCHMFVSFNANRAGVGPDAFPYTASCGTGVAWFKQRGRYRRHDEYTPIKGDVVYFTSDGSTPGHVGIVRVVDGGYVYTVEGNTGTKKGPDGKDALIPNGGGVAFKGYALTSGYILGYGSPDYKLVEDELDMTIDEAKKELTAIDGTGATSSPWAKDATAALTEAGIFTGDGQGNYGWGQCVTREQLAVALYKLYCVLKPPQVLQ